MRSRQRRTHKLNTQQPCSPSLHTPSNSSRTKALSPLCQGRPPEYEVLVKENRELKKQIMELKVHQFYHFDDDKLKNLLGEVQELRKELKELRDQAKGFQLEKDFLTRTNCYLKAELQKQIKNTREKQKVSCKTSEIMGVTDTSRHSEDSLSHLTNHSQTTLPSPFINPPTITPPSNDYQIDSLREGSKGELKVSRRMLMEKVLSPRRRGQSKQVEYHPARKKEGLLGRLG